MLLKMSGGSDTKFNIVRLNEKNYFEWQFQMMNLLKWNELWVVIENEKPEPPNLTDTAAEVTRKNAAIATFELKSSKAITLMSLYITEGEISFVMGCETAKDFWMILKDRHIQKTRQSRRAVEGQFIRKRIDGSTSMKTHLSEMNSLFVKFEQLGGVLSEDTKITTITESVRQHYSVQCDTFDAWPDNTITLKDVQTKLTEAWESRQALKAQANQAERGIPSESGLSAQQSSTSGTSSTGNARSNSNKKKKKWFDRPKTWQPGKGPQCKLCHSIGHVKDWCPVNPDSSSPYNMAKTSEVTNAVALVGTSSSASSHRAKRGISKSSNRTSVFSRLGCQSCNMQGHTSKDCGFIKFGEKPEQDVEKQKNSEINEYSARFDRLKSFSQYSFCVGNLMNEHWAIDSGASAHMCKDKSLFSKMNFSERGIVYVADGNRTPYYAKGDVKLTLNHEGSPFEIILTDVLFVPKLETNLISVRKISKRGFRVEFLHDTCTLDMGENKSILFGTFQNGLFRINSYHACSTSHQKLKCVHEWHLRMAHRNINDIMLMKSRGLKIKDCKCDNVCESCIYGKMTTTPFPKDSEKAKQVLDVVVTDVCGYMPTESIGKARYYVSFTDECSHYCEIYFIRHKDEVKTKLKEYVAMVQNQIGKTPKIIRCDRGGEYLDEHGVQDFLKQEGIKFQCTVGYASQQNGKAERKHRTILDAVRSMLKQANLPPFLWAETAKAAVDIQNRMIDRKSNQIPYEQFFDTELKGYDFQLFGGIAYSRIPEQKRKKLDDKAEKLIYIRHDNHSKGYRLYDPNRQRMIISRNVKFLDIFFYEKSNEIRTDNETIQSFDPLDSLDPHHNHDTSSIENEQQFEEEQSFEEEQPLEEEPIIRRTTRTTAGIPPERYGNPVVYTTIDFEHFEPQKFNEAINCPEKDMWIKAMNEELNSMEQNRTWSLVDLPSNRKSVGCTWVFKIKHNEDGNLKYKARLVAQGFTQKFGIDFDEVFAPVARSSTLRMLLSECGARNLHVKHYDVKSAFLNGNLDEEVYMRQPPGYNFGDGVLKLHKSIYGLKQAANVWNKTLNDVLEKANFKSCEVDRCLYYKHVGSEVCYLLIHVDDILISSRNVQLIESTAANINHHFQITSLGEAKTYLGIELERDLSGNFLISQARYVDKILLQSGLKDAKIAKHPLSVGYFKQNDPKICEKLENNEEYRKLIGKLLYLCTQTRPDIAASVCILAQRVSCPTKNDLNEVKRIIRYLKFTRNFKLKLSLDSSKNDLIMFSDANWAEDAIDRKSNSGFIAFTNGGVISWCCRKQTLVALSSMEAEYIALSEATKEVIWLRKLRKFFGHCEQTTDVYVDNQSCLSNVQNQKFSNRTKHIDTRHHFIRDLVNKKTIKLHYVPTELNTADLLTKPLGTTRIAALNKQAGLGGELNEQYPNHPSKTDESDEDE